MFCLPYRPIIPNFRPEDTTLPKHSAECYPHTYFEGLMRCHRTQFDGTMTALETSFGGTLRAIIVPNVFVLKKCQMSFDNSWVAGSG